MFLFNLIFLLVGRFLIKIFITVFGWAFKIFFGEIHGEKGKLFYAANMLAFFWVVLLSFFLYPSIKQVIIIYIENKGIKGIDWHLLSFIGILLLPYIIGILGLKINDISCRNFIFITKKGFYYSFLFGISQIFMLLFAPLITVKRFLFRQYVVNISAAADNSDFMKKIKHCCEESLGYTEIKKAPVTYSLPFWILQNPMKDIFNRASLRNFVVCGKGFKIYFNSYDIMMEGKKNKVQILRGKVWNMAILENIFTAWSEEGRDIEKVLIQTYYNYKQNIITTKETAYKIEQLRQNINYIDMEDDEWNIINMRILAVYNVILKNLNEF